MKAILVHSVGGPEVLHYQETELAEPGPLEVVVRNHAIGVRPQSAWANRAMGRWERNEAFR